MTKSSPKPEQQVIIVATVPWREQQLQLNDWLVWQRLQLSLLTNKKRLTVFVIVTILNLTTELHLYTLLYKAKEFVCLFERANFRNYWFNLKKNSVLDSPFFEKGYKLYIIGLKPIRAVEKREKVITIWVIVDRRRYRKRGCVVQLVLLIIVLWILTTCLPLFMFLAAGASININLHKCDETKIYKLKLGRFLDRIDLAVVHVCV